MFRTFPMVWRWLKYPVAFALAGIGLVLAWCGIACLVAEGADINAANGSWIAATFISSAWSLGLAVALVRRPRASAAKPAGTARRIFRLLALAAGVSSLCVTLAPFLVVGSMIAQLWGRLNPGPFDRPRMEQLVAQVRQFDFKGNKDFFVDPSGKVRPEEAGEAPHTGYEIVAQCDDDGTLTMVIITRKFGHDGVYGFAYSDKILKPQPDEYSYGGLSLEVPSEAKETDHGGKIDDHWWKVADTQT